MAHSDGLRDSLQTMWAKAAAPDIDDLTRANRARVAVETAEDLAVLIQNAPKIFPGIGLATLREDAGKADSGNPLRDRNLSASQILKTRTNLNAQRSTIVRALSGFDGIAGGKGHLPLVDSPFNAAPLMDMAEPLLAVDHLSSVVPGLLPGVEGKVNASDYSVDAATLIEDVGRIPDMAGFSIPVTDHVIDFGDDNAGAYIDQLIADAVDRAAERHIGNLLVTAAGTPIDGTDLADALDSAEATVAAAAESSAGLLIVNLADWPKVRRAVASAWQIGPHPTPLVSVAAPAGTALMVGGGILRVEAQAILYAAQRMGGRGPKDAYNIRHGARWLSAYRYFRAIIRADAGVAAITI